MNKTNVQAPQKPWEIQCPVQSVLTPRTIGGVTKATSEWLHDDQVLQPDLQDLFLEQCRERRCQQNEQMRKLREASFKGWR
jgi:hypothetical protein